MQQLTQEESAVAAQELDLFKLLHLRATFPSMILVGSSKVGGRDVYVVDASIKSLGLCRSLFFDAETRLLIGSIVALQETGGTETREEFYSDFRIVDGVKLPFAVRAVDYNLHNSVEITRTRIECDIPLRDDFFLMNSTTTETSARQSTTVGGKEKRK